MKILERHVALFIERAARTNEVRPHEQGSRSANSQQVAVKILPAAGRFLDLKPRGSDRATHRERYVKHRF
jgi:hypothetical protein